MSNTDRRNTPLPDINQNKKGAFLDDITPDGKQSKVTPKVHDEELGGLDQTAPNFKPLDRSDHDSIQIDKES